MWGRSRTRSSPTTLPRQCNKCVARPWEGNGRCGYCTITHTAPGLARVFPFVEAWSQLRNVEKYNSAMTFITTHMKPTELPRSIPGVRYRDTELNKSALTNFQQKIKTGRYVQVHQESLVLLDVFHMMCCKPKLNFRLRERHTFWLELSRPHIYSRVYYLRRALAKRKNPALIF